MLTLLDLPDEILLSILYRALISEPPLPFAKIQDPFSRPIVCKRLSRISREVLGKHVSFRVRDFLLPEKTRQIRNHLAGTQRLTVTLQLPWAASSVSVLNLLPHGGHSLAIQNDRPMERPPINPNQFCESLGCVTSLLSLSLVRVGVTPQTLDQIFKLCPSLATLHSEDVHIPNVVLSANTCPPSTNLRHLVFRSSTDILLCHRLLDSALNVRTIDSDASTFIKGFPLFPSSLQKVHVSYPHQGIYEALSHGIMLKAFDAFTSRFAFSSLANLEQLHVLITSMPMSTIFNERRQFDGLVATLVRAQPRISQLFLEFDCDDPDPLCTEILLNDIGGSLRSEEHFPNLKIVHISYRRGSKDAQCPSAGCSYLKAALVDRQLRDGFGELWSEEKFDWWYDKRFAPERLSTLIRPHIEYPTLTWYSSELIE